MKKYLPIFIHLAFALYCAVMVWLLFGQRVGAELSGADHNFVPFRTITHFIAVAGHADSAYLVRFASINLAGNVAMFIPLGIFLPCLWPELRTFWRFLLAAGLCVAAIEAVQLLSGLGVCDIDDWILNMLGAGLGFALFRLMPTKQTRE